MIIAGDAGRHDAACAASAGTSTRRSRPIAASCFRSARSDTPASPAPSIWIDPRLEAVRDLPVEPPASRRQGRRRRRCAARVATVAAAALIGGGAAGDPAVPRIRPAPTSARRRALRPSAATPTTGAHRHRRARARRLRAAEGQAGRPGHQPHRPRATASAPSTCSTARRACSWSRSSAPSTAFAACSTTTCPRRATRRPACRFTRSTATPGGPPRRCSQGLDTLVIDLQDIGARFYTYTRRWAT